MSARQLDQISGIPWLNIALEQFLEVPRGAPALLELFFKSGVRGQLNQWLGSSWTASYNVRSNVAGVLEEYGKDRPSVSKTELMVLALSASRVTMDADTN
jgi:hypothetical protein